MSLVCVRISYNHSRDDEEVYKEFLEIANEIIPQILRMDHEDAVLTGDPAAYALLLSFYDGLCCWEEDSQTPVLHITWATHMLSSISKFSADARTAVELRADDDDDNQRTTGSNTSAVDGTSAPAASAGVRPHRARRRHVTTMPEPSSVGGKSSNGSLGGLQVATVDYDVESCCGGRSSSEVSPAMLSAAADATHLSLIHI